MKVNPSQSWILDSTPWIPDSRYWIPLSVSGTWILGSNIDWDSRFFELYCGFQSPEFRIPQAQFSRIPESVFPYAMRSLFVAKDISPHDTFQPYELSADQITVLAF